MITPEEHRLFISRAIEGNIDKAETFLILKILNHFSQIISRSKSSIDSPYTDTGENGICLAEVVREMLEHEKVEMHVKRHLSRCSIEQAAMFNHVGVVRELLRHNTVDINTRCRANQTPLILASGSGYVEVVRELLKHDDVDVNAPCRSGTALTTAARCGHAEVVIELLNDKRMKMNARDLKRLTAQTLAERKADPNHLKSPMVRELLQAKLFWASEHGYAEMIRESIKHEALDWNLKTHRGRTPLIVASEWGQLKVVNELLKVQAVDVNAQDDDGRTSLIMASSVGHVKMVLALLKHRKVIVDAKDNSGRSALMWAGELGHTQVVRALLANSKVRKLSKVGKFDVNVDSGIGRATLMTLSGKGHAGNVGEFLKRWMVDVNVDSGNDFNALISAWQRSHAKVVRQFSSRSPFMVSPRGRPDGVVELLKRVKMDVNAMTRRDRPSLAWANGKHQMRIVGEALRFMQANADANDGWDAFCLASEGGHYAVALLKHKAVDASDKDKDGNTALIDTSDGAHLEALCDTLRQEKVDVNANREDETTRLFLVSGKGHDAIIVRRLSKREGVDLTAEDDKRQSALMTASGEDPLKVVSDSLTHQHMVDVIDSAAHFPSDALDSVCGTVCVKAQVAGPRERYD